MANGEPPKDYVTPKERLAEQDWAGVAKKGISSLTPADKGWMLALVLLFAIMTGANMWNEHRSSIALVTYLDNQQQNTTKVEEHRSEEMRRCQETIKALNEALARQTERLGRSVTQPKPSEGTNP